MDFFLRYPGHCAACAKKCVCLGKVQLQRDRFFLNTLLVTRSERGASRDVPYFTVISGCSGEERLGVHACK
jgi:hypothetical protein